MRHVFMLPLLLAASSCTAPKVDPGLVGTWELNVPNADGVARWVWDIQAAGLYEFHAEGPGGVPSHRGTFEARNGQYVLRSTTIAWVDTGTYQLISHDTLSATGKLGTASWTRVQPASGKTPNDSSPSPDTTTTAPEGKPGVYAATTLYDYFSHHTFDDHILTAPWTLTRTTTVAPDPRQQGDGVLGVVEAGVQGSTGPATISLTVYRDRAAAEAAWDLDALFDSKTFRSQPGELVSSHAYTYRERGEARCLSRLLVDSSTTATVTCYLLVQYPTREPVMIQSQVQEQVAAGMQEASMTAVERANDLLFAGIKEWALAYPLIGGGESQ